MILRKFGVADVDRALVGESLPVAARPRWQNAIEHINAALDRADQIVGLADTHQITRLVGGELIGCIIKATQHRLLPFANGQSAHSIAVKADVDQRISRALAQFFIERALLDAEQGGTFSMFAACIKGIA